MSVPFIPDLDIDCKCRQNQCMLQAIYFKKKNVIGHLVISSKSFTLNTKDEGICEKGLFDT